jgi:N-acyl-D-amino-acid deacylase
MLVACGAAFGVSACGQRSSESGGTEQVGSTKQPLVGDGVQTAPTGFWWLTEATADAVTQAVQANNARLTSIQVAQTNPLLLTVTMVQNTGVYAKQSWWYPGLSLQDLVYRARVLNARPISIDPYVDSHGNTLLAAVLVSNLGVDAEEWWLVADVDGDTLQADLNKATRRLFDWRQYSKQGQTLNAAIMVANTPPDGTSFLYYAGQTPAQIASLVNNPGGNTLVSLQPADPNAPTFNVILYPNSTVQGPPIQWFYGATAADLGTLIAGKDLRWADIKTYVSNGTTLHTAIAVANSPYSGTSATEAACDAEMLSDWKANPPSVGVGAPAAAAIFDANIIAYMEQWNLPGAALGVVKNGQLVLARGYGFSDQASAQIAHPDNLFRLASLSKGITAAAVLTAVNQKLFNLDDSVFQILGLTPNPPTCCAGQTACSASACTQTRCESPLLSTVTIRNLLNHTAGFSDKSNCTIVTPVAPAGAPTPVLGNNSSCPAQGDPTQGGDYLFVEGQPGNSVPLTAEQMVQFWMANRDCIGGNGTPGNAPTFTWTPAGPLGSGTTAVEDYSNFGYTVLQALIEKVTGTSYATWVAANVLAPAGASGIQPGRTDFTDPSGSGYRPVVLDHEVTYYDNGGGVGQSYYDTQNICGNGPDNPRPCVPTPYGAYALETTLGAGGWVASPVDLLRLLVALDGSRGGTPLLTPSNVIELQRDPAAWFAPGAPPGTTGPWTLMLNPPGHQSWYGFGFNIGTNGVWANFGEYPTSTLTYEYRAGQTGDLACFDSSGMGCDPAKTSPCSCVSTANYDWVVAFNSDPTKDERYALDQVMKKSLWQVILGGHSWGTGNLFDQYGAYSGWLNDSDFKNYVSVQKNSGMYPSHVEGQSQTGTPLYRASFVPFATTQGAAWFTVNGMDCITYKQQAPYLAAEGYHPVSLQSFVGSDGLRRYQGTWIQGGCTPTTCSTLGANCGTPADGCGGSLDCGICSSPQTCGGGGTANVCGGGCSFTVTANSYNGGEQWGTVTFTNSGTVGASNYVVAFDVPAGTHCTNDTVPAGATLGPLNGTGANAMTVSNHCVFTWTNAATIAPGASFTFNYSTNKTTTFDASASTTVNDSACDPVHAKERASCSFSVLSNGYDGPEYWGTASVTNEGPSTSSNYSVAFDVPTGAHCTNDFLPPGATLGPLNGTGTNATTLGNHCVYTWTNGPPLGPGASLTFNYSADTTVSFTATQSTVVSDSVCALAPPSCALAVTKNSYAGSQYWGTVTVTNAGPASASSYSVAFDIPAGAHCTNDSLPPGATLSPLNGTGSSARTVSNHCVYTWPSATPLAPGGSLTFHYSADTAASFDATSRSDASDAVCAP